MIELTIVRHADAEWGSSAISDHDRPLSRRGIRQATAMAELLRAQDARPDRIISSTAVRALRKAETFAAVLGVPASAHAPLYGAGPRTLLAVAKESATTRVLLVAHDPGLSTLAYTLTETITALPTAGVVRFAWSADSWDAALSRPPDSWIFDRPEP
jgi:phosphohistidine phosphatase